MAICGCVATPRPLTVGPATTLPLLEVLASVSPAQRTGVLAAIERCRNTTNDRVVVLSTRSHEQAVAGEPPDPADSRSAVRFQWIQVTADAPWFAPANPAGAISGTLAESGP